MTTSTRIRATRAAVDEWAFPAIFAVGYVLTIAQQWDVGGWRAGLTTLLAGLGYVITMLAKQTVKQHNLHPDDRHRLNVLAAQAFGAFLVATLVSGIYPSPPGGVPIVLALAGVGTILLAAEAVVIRFRGPRRDT